MMVVMAQLPQEYTPYEELVVCSNIMVKCLMPFEIGGYIPLLVGKGKNPRVWLQFPIDPTRGKWAYLVKDNVSEATIPDYALDLNISMKEGLVTISVGKFIILHVRRSSESKAIISQLDLRPIGLNIYGDEEGIHIANEHFSQNTFENMRSMIVIAKTWQAVLTSPDIFEPLSPEQEREQTEEQLSDKIEEATRFHETEDMTKTQEILNEIESFIKEKINDITDLSLFEKWINLELSFDDENRNKAVIESLYLYGKTHGISRDLLPLAIRVALKAGNEKVAFEIYDELRRKDPNDPLPNIELGLMYFVLGNYKEAVKETEEALKKSLNSNLEKLAILSKANVAYYYADAGSEENKEKAIEYANFALDHDPNNPAYKDTLGFVKIIFGQTPEEIKEGMTMCDEVRKEGGPLEYYEKHITIALQRLKEL